MIDKVKPYRAALSIRVVSDLNTEGRDLGMWVDGLRALLRGGCTDLARGVKSAGFNIDLPDYAMVTLYSPDYGFGWSYWDTKAMPRPLLLIGGHVPNPFESGMPTLVDGKGMRLAGVCDIISLYIPLLGLWDRLADHSVKQGCVQMRPDWEFEWEQVISSAYADATAVDLVIPEHEYNPEDN